MKKFYFLLACLLIGLTTSVAQEAAVINNIKYYLENGQATIMTQDKSLSGDIVIPQTVEKDGKKYRVLSITSSAFSETKISSIVLPEGITALPDRCFSKCSSLNSITIPNSVTSLGEACFSSCSSLKSITIPNGVTSLGSSCFYYCSSLESITIPGSVTSLGSRCFGNCSNLLKVTPQWTDLSKVRVSADVFSGIFPEAKLYVPKGTTAMYKAKEPWNMFKYIVEEGGTVEPSKKCETPVIDYKDGQLVFTSATEGAQYHYTLTDNAMAQDAFSENGKVRIGGVYDISVYASAAGYTNSDVATGKLYFLNATMNPSSITVPAQRGVLVQVHNGEVSVSGLNDGERAALYTIDGRLITTATTIAGVARLQSGNTQGIAVLKVGEQSHKIVLK